MTNLYYAIKQILLDHNNLFELVFRLKGVIRATKNMYRTQNLKDAFEKIIEETKLCLNCDISRLFVIDNEKGDLWTKVNNGKLEIRIPLEEGIEGYVATKEESVNVMDAY